MKTTKQILHTIILMLLIIVNIFTLSACENSELTSIEPSKTIRGAYGEHFEMYVSEASQLTDDIAKCSVKVVFEKENDITNKNDYDGSYFYKYSYSVSIEGTLDAKYAGRKVVVHIIFLPIYNTSRYKACEVSENGTFSCSFTFGINGIVTEWIPFKVDVL